MRTCILLASLLYALTVIAGDHDPAPASPSPSSRFVGRIIAPSPRAAPFTNSSRLDRAVLAKCCKVCTKGKPCGDTCIAQDKTCHVPPGCAC